MKKIIVATLLTSLSSSAYLSSANALDLSGIKDALKSTTTANSASNNGVSVSVSGLSDS